MRESIFDLMQKEGLTHLQIHYNWVNGKFVYYGAREWDDDIKWTEFNKSFDVLTMLTDKPKFHSHDAMEQMFKDNNLSEYVEKIKNLMRGSRHCLEDFYYWAKEDVRFLNNIHNTRLGRQNRQKALVMGGIRRHVREEDEIEMIIDGMNLGRGMSFKNIAAKVPMGGCKITVMQDQLDLDNLENIAFLAYANERTMNVTGPDMLFPTEMTGIVKKNWSQNFTGDPKGILGETGGPTAYGVYIAGKIAAQQLWGSDDVSNKTVAIQGLGAVGYPLAEYYAKACSRLIVADCDEAPIKKLKEQFPSANITVVSPQEIITTQCDILAPCAIGGVIHDGNIGQLKCAAIFGSANNQLRATCPEEEIAVAEKVAARNILFQTDWMHNLAGVLAAYQEYTLQDQVNPQIVEKKVEEAIYENTTVNLTEAKKAGITPTRRAYEVASKILFG